MADEEKSGVIAENVDKPVVEEDKGKAEVKVDEGAGGESVKDEPLEDPEKHVVLVRKSAIPFILARKDAKIAKLSEKKAEEVDPAEDEELTPRATELIDQKIAPIVQTFKHDTDEREVSDYLQKNPDHKKYEPLARKYMEAKGYEVVPVEMIFNHLSAKESERRGAEKERKAQEESRRKGVGANSRKAEDGEPDFKNMSTADFLAYQKEHRKY